MEALLSECPIRLIAKDPMTAAQPDVNSCDCKQDFRAEKG
jgi:hypothetical protein